MTATSPRHGGRGSNQYARRPSGPVAPLQHTTPLTASLHEDDDPEEVGWAFRSDRVAWETAGVVSYAEASPWLSSGGTPDDFKAWADAAAPSTPPDHPSVFVLRITTNPNTDMHSHQVFAARDLPAVQARLVQYACDNWSVAQQGDLPDFGPLAASRWLRNPTLRSAGECTQPMFGIEVEVSAHAAVFDGDPFVLVYSDRDASPSVHVLPTRDDAERMSFELREEEDSDVDDEDEDMYSEAWNALRSVHIEQVEWLSSA